MSGLIGRITSHERFGAALRAGFLAAGLAVVAGAPMAAQAHDGWRGERWEHHHRHHGWYGPRYVPAPGYYVAPPPRAYYAPPPAYYAPPPAYYAPGAALSFSFR